MFSLFQMPLKDILKNKIILQKNHGLQEAAIDKWSFWQFEENIKIINEIVEEEEKQKKKEDDSQKNANFNPSSYLRNLSNVSNKFKS